MERDNENGNYWLEKLISFTCPKIRLTRLINRSILKAENSNFN